MLVFLLHSMKLLFTKPIPPNPAPSKIIPIISETLYIYLIGFHEAKFDITDFATAKARGCEGFTLLVSRTPADSRDCWFGAFQRGDERLDVIGHLE